MLSFKPSPCPRPFCGGTILPQVYSEPMKPVEVVMICHLCSRDPMATTSTVELVRAHALAGYVPSMDEPAEVADDW